MLNGCNRILFQINYMLIGNLFLSEIVKDIFILNKLHYIIGQYYILCVHMKFKINLILFTKKTFFFSVNMN